MMRVQPGMYRCLCGVGALALPLFMSAPMAVTAEQCNVDREECGFLNNRQCPDPSSGHPDHLNRCCQRDSLGCYTACCADYFSGSVATVVIMVVFVTFCLLCPVLAYCCKRCSALRTRRQNERAVEEQLQRTERSFDEREHARRANQRTETPPCYYGPDEKAPDYEQALGHTVLVPSGESTANLLANAQGTTPPSTATPSPRSNPGTGSAFSSFFRRPGSGGSSSNTGASATHEQQQQQQQPPSGSAADSTSGRAEAQSEHSFGAEQERGQARGQALSSSQRNAVTEIDFRAPTPSDPPAYDSLVADDDSASATSQLTDSLPVNPAPSSTRVHPLRSQVLRHNAARTSAASSQRSATPLSELEEQDV